MKTSYRSYLFLLFFIVILSSLTISVSAATLCSGITLDGNFTDWVGKPDISDIKHDIKSSDMDFIDGKYIADNDYLYLYVERLAATKSVPWQFQVILPNGTLGKNKNIDLFNKGKLLFVPVFDITVSFDKGVTLVNVSYNGQTIETTLSGSANGKVIEFRIPLKIVGLGGFNQEIQFALLSGNDKAGTDYLPDAYPITLTTGPTGGTIISILFFIGVSIIVLKKHNLPPSPRAGNVAKTFFDK